MADGHELNGYADDPLHPIPLHPIPLHAKIPWNENRYEWTFGRRRWRPDRRETDDDDNDDNDDDDMGFPTVGFPKAELISKLLNKISVWVDVSKSLETYFLFENEILIDDIVVIFGIYGVDFPPKGSPKRS